MATSTERAIVVKEGDYVILKKANNLRLQQVLSQRDFWIDKTKCTLEGLIDHPYGTTFEVKDGKFTKMAKPEQLEVDTSDGIDTEKDNRNLLDSDANQKLTMEEIEKMKKEGVSGDKLIEQLIENSTTFQTKTGYAQEKWVKKKQKKHLMEFTVLKPTSRLLCELQWSKGPARICHLRVDTLALMLTWGNVRAHSRIAVVDTCQGLVTGAVLERLGGFGTLINLYHGESPKHMTYQLERYGFSQEILAPLKHYPLDGVNNLKCGKTVALVKNGDQTKPATEVSGSNMIESNTEKMDTNDSETTPVIEVEVEGEQIDIDKKDETSVKLENNREENGGEGVEEKEAEQDERIEGRRSRKKGKGKIKHKTFEERMQAKQEKAQEAEEARQFLLQKNLDCLIVACKFYPTPIVLALLEYLLPSRQLVVFSQHKEALQDCYSHLREQKGVINYRLTEAWLRDYQVLPNRTHPVIQMSGTGGYLLTATTVTNNT